MASWQARAAAHTVKWRVRPALGDMSDLLRVRAVFGSTLPPPRGVRFTPGTLGGVAGEWVDAARPAAEDAPLLMYVHGGGFIGGSPATHRPVTAAFARRGLRVFVPDYRLAPEHPFPAALDDCIAAWRAFAAAHPGRRLVVAGDSAGGGLTVALLLALRDAGDGLPAAGVCISPWTDLACEGASMTSHADRDPMVQRDGLLQMAAAYLAGQDPRAPLASPIHADLRRLPPLLVHVGTAETLLDDATRLAERARAAGVAVDLEVWDDMIHVWHAFAPLLPDADEAIARIGTWVRSALRT